MSIKKAVQAVGAAKPQDGKNESQPSFPIPILPDLPADVKMLREFQERNIPNMDIIDTMRTAWPGFDKTLLSKCRNHKHYGVGLRREAVKLLSEHFHMDEPTARHQPNRKKPHRIQCRVSDATYSLLQRRIAQTGQSTQDYLESIILADIKSHEKELTH